MVPRLARPYRLVLVCLLCLGVLGAARADWREHRELPTWARRGAVQWGHGGNINGRKIGRAHV